MKRTKYTAEFKSEIVKQTLDKEYSVVEVSSYLGVPPPKKVIRSKTRVWLLLTPFKMKKIAMKNPDLRRISDVCLHQTEGDTAVKDLCLSLGISQALYIRLIVM